MYQYILTTRLLQYLLYLQCIAFSNGKVDGSKPQTMKMSLIANVTIITKQLRICATANKYNVA